MGGIMPLFSILALLAFAQPDATEVSRKLLKHFQNMEDLHFRGEFHSTDESTKSTEKSVFDFYKKGEKLKYFEKLVELKNENDKDKIENANEFEFFKNEIGVFNINNDPKTGIFHVGTGDLFINNSDIIGLKLVYINKPLVPLTGNYGFTVANSPQNPCYSFEELLQISKAEVKKENLDGVDCQQLTLISPWGLVQIWVDPVLFRPLKAEAHLTNKSLQSTGETVEAAQKNRSYKTLKLKATYFYTYDPKETRFQIPQQVRQIQTETGRIGTEIHDTIDNCLIRYTLVEPFSSSMNNKMVISSTAKNGTTIHLPNLPQIAYHLEEGQLVLSANHQFLNKISQTVFGGPGFWQRLALILVPLVLTATLGLFLWIRWRPKIP